MNSRDIAQQMRVKGKLEESERRFRALVEHISEVVVVLDENGYVLYASPSLERVSGYTVEERIGRSGFERLHPDDVAAARRALGRVLSGPGATVSGEVRMRHEDGTWRRVELTAKNVLDDPAVRGIVVTYRDVTERVQRESRLRQSQRLEAVGRLAGGVAHNFNNHMTVVSGYTSILLDGLEGDDPRRDDVEEIQRAAARATALTRRLLAFGRRQALRPKVLDPCELIQGLETPLQRVIGETVELDLALDPETSRIEADPTQMEQALMHLVVNARDAMPEGGRLEIATENVELPRVLAEPFPHRVGPGAYVQIEVADTGYGMDAETRQHMFEPFFTTKEQGSGTGLGLATVYGIVMQNGGYIGVESEVGEGTTFRIYLPRVGVGLSATPHAPSSESQCRSGNSWRSAGGDCPPSRRSA